MKTIDAKGQLCPTPLIMTKRAVSQASQGEQIIVLCDNTTAKCNLMDYITELGFSAECEEYSPRQYRITFTIDKEASPKAISIDPVCQPPSQNRSDDTSTPYAVVLKSETMGSGDPQLGAILMRACINSLAELDSLPKVIIMYNSSVKLAVEGTDTAQSLKKLSDQGIQIILCGTCVDFYELKDKIAVGTIGNMLKINTILSKTSHIIYP